MKKIVAILISSLILNSGISQNRKISVDSVWTFSYPDFLSFKEAVDSNVFIYSSYYKSDMYFEFLEDSMLVKTYIKDSLVESSHVCEILRGRKEIVYKTHPRVKGRIYDGHFTIIFKNRRKKTPIIFVCGYTEPDVINGIIAPHPRIKK